MFLAELKFWAGLTNRIQCYIRRRASSIADDELHTALPQNNISQKTVNPMNDNLQSAGAHDDAMQNALLPRFLGQNGF